MSDEKLSRTRWKPKELRDVAEAMAQLLADEPGLHPLKAARRAQERVIAPDRQRDLKAWSVLEPQIGELLAEAQAAVQAQRAAIKDANIATDPAASAPAAETLASAVSTADGSEAQAVAADAVAGADSAVDSKTAGTQCLPAVEANGRPQDRQQHPTDEQSSKPLQQQPREHRSLANTHTEGELGAMLAVSMESALLVALQSSAVEDALTSVFGRAFKRSMDEQDTGELRETEAGRIPDRRVLLAGFPVQMAKGIEDALRTSFDVRRWMPNQGPQMLETLTRLCSIAVIPEEAEDEMGEAFSGRDLQVVRHQGSPARLAERLSELTG